MSATPAEAPAKSARSALFDLEEPIRDLRDGACAARLIADYGMTDHLSVEECRGLNFVAEAMLAKAEAALEHLRAALEGTGDAHV